ncbi:MAG: beta-galactosidase [Candidatus Paceibacterota bacterium]|jgi:hypothetical protein
MKRAYKIIILLLIVSIAGIYLMSIRQVSEKIIYGVSFSKLHSDELNLDWKEVYAAILDELGVKHLRLSAHWFMVEPKKGEYNWNELDYQISEAQKRGADVILAIGRRLPGWPECHDPEWGINLDSKTKQDALLDYMETAVNRYKDAPNLRFWQVENEAFLSFATQYCNSADEVLLAKEIDLVKKLDPNHKILVTDSGEMGKWYQARRYGDIFGTSVYLYIWHDLLGPLRYPITPGFFRFKQNIIDLASGPKQTILIELGAEPWLMQPIVKAPISVQLDRMGLDKMKEVVKFNQKTGFSEQYLWGAEWWYYMKNNGHPEFWGFAKSIYDGEQR